MINFLRWFFGLGAPPPPKYARVNIDVWRNLKPGHVEVLYDDETGHSWALMHLDDFDHVVDHAKLRRVNSSVPCQTKP